MKIKKQKIKLPVYNLDVMMMGSGGGEERKHGTLFPSSIRCLICGSSNSGKTNILLRLLIDPNGLKFENVYIYSRTLDQRKYQFLKEALKPIKGLGYYTFRENEEILLPNKAKPNSIFIFDDVSCDNQQIIRHYFSMGRHQGVDSFYLCQSYARIPKHLLRDNANVIILFKQDQTNLKHVYNDHCSSDVSYNQLVKMCAECWKEPYQFLMIDKDSDMDAGRYRKGFDAYIYL